MLVYTLIQALTDGAARQVLPSALANGERRFAANYGRTAAVLGFTAVLTSCLIVATLTDPAFVWALAPLSLAPVFTAIGIGPVARLQIAGRWRTLATAQLISSVASLAVSVPVMLVTHGIAGAVIQIVLAEALNAAWCRYSARNLWRAPNTADPLRTGRTLRSLVAMSAYGGLAWLQGQSDRVFLATFAGASTLGTYSFASSIARTPGDALASSTANLVRATISEPGLAPDEVREKTRGTLTRALGLGSAGFSVTLVAAFALTWVMPPVWSTAVQLVPLMGVVCIPSALNWSSAPILLAAGRSRLVSIAPLVGLALAPLIGLAALQSLQLAIGLVIVRELAVLTTSYIAGRGYVNWIVYGTCVVITALGVMVQAPITALISYIYAS